MKYIQLSILEMKNISITTKKIKKFVYEERIPLPVKIELYAESGSNFVNNEVTICIHSMALVKYKK